MTCLSLPGEKASPASAAVVDEVDPALADEIDEEPIVQEVTSSVTTEKEPLATGDDEDDHQETPISNKENEQNNKPEKEGVPAMESQEGEEPQFDIPKGEALRAKFDSYFNEDEEGKESQPELTPEEKKKELRRKLAQSKLGKVTKKEEEAPEEVKEACVLPKSNDVFEEISRIMHAILSENRGKNLKVKRLVIYNLLPSLVNKSKSFMKHLHSARFMVLIDDAMQVNWGSK